MIIKTVDAPIFIDKFLKHENKKQEILNAIDTMGKFSCKRNGCSLQHTDWYLPENYPRPYWDLVKTEIERHVKQAAESYSTKVNDTYITNCWVQEYGVDDYHEWHFHSHTMFSSIYYLELPNNTNTTFKFLECEFDIECKEGDILTFPSCLSHCSKPNKSEQRKTVIAFNWSIN